MSCYQHLGSLNLELLAMVSALSHAERTSPMSRAVAEIVWRLGSVEERSSFCWLAQVIRGMA